MAEIVAEPALRIEARLVAPKLRELAKSGCDGEMVKRALQPLVLVFGVSDAARTAAFWTVYIKALSDLPIEAVVKAVEDYPRQPDAEFFPKPGPLRALALQCAGPIYQAASRAWQAARITPAPPVVRGTPEQRQRFADEIRASLGIRQAGA